MNISIILDFFHQDNSIKVLVIWLLKFILFTILNTIYVIGNTLKSLMTNAADPDDQKAIKDSSNMSAMVYAFYTIIIKQTVGCDIFTTIVGTYISNLIGNNIGIIISPKFIARKYVKHRVSLTHKNNENLTAFIRELWELRKQKLLKYNHNTVVSESKEDFNIIDKFEEFKIWTLNSDADKKVLELFKKYNVKHSEITLGK